MDITLRSEIKSRQIESSPTGFRWLCSLASRLEDCLFETINLDLMGLTWFDANLCSVLGAIFYKANRNINTVKITNLPNRIKNILSKNNFLSSYGGGALEDTYSTTIQYLRFDKEDDRFFVQYLENNLMGKAIPRMSPALHDEFIGGLMEIFNNAVIHSETRYGIFACGQYFPAKERVDFTITDLGIGIRENIKKHRGYDFSAENAIDWAMSGNTTKRKADGIPGGLGLKCVREFIRKNQGYIQVVSNNGYWEQTRDGNVNMELFPDTFPGTVVNISINTSDPCSYKLSSEVSLNEIF